MPQLLRSRKNSRRHPLKANTRRNAGEHPLVEPVTEALMLALHAARRTNEALDLYARTRARLAEDLGTDPGPDLQASHRSLLRGEITSSFSLTEPHFAGSDPTMIATRAERDGDEYVLNGHKWFVSNASKADFILMMAVTNPENPPHKAASFFIIPKGTPGLDIARDVFNMGHPYPGHFRS